MDRVAFFHDGRMEIQSSISRMPYFSGLLRAEFGVVDEISRIHVDILLIDYQIDDHQICCICSDEYTTLTIRAKSVSDNDIIHRIVESSDIR